MKFEALEIIDNYEQKPQPQGRQNEFLFSHLYSTDGLRRCSTYSYGG